MPTPNPLNEFNTYAYHHFLVIAKTTEIAETVTSDTGAFFRYLRGEANDGTIPENGMRVIVNPLSSVKYIIQDLTLENIIEGDARATGATISTTYSSGSMTIVEPRGVRFFNEIFDTYRALGAGAGDKSAVWMIKTVFVGHNTTPGKPPVEYFANIKPMIVTPVDITSEFTEAGGRYNIEFVVMNAGSGFTRNSNSQAITVGSTLKLSGDASLNGTVTLAQALKSLEDRIRNNYEKSYTAAVSSSGQQLAKKEFKINLAKRYQDPSYVINVTSEESAGGGAGDGILSMSPETRLDQWIGELLKRCPKLIEEADKGASERWMPKLTSQTLRTDQGEYHTSEVYDILACRVRPTDDGITLGEKSAMLEYDYIYTGKNTDILSFDMKMNMAIAFLEEITASAAMSVQGQIPAKQTTNSSAAQPLIEGESGPTMVPPTVATSGSVLHSTRPQATATYEELLNRAVEAETIASNITIRGNPLLFNDMIMDSATINALRNGTDTSNQLIGDWMVEPVTVRVNVMMPTDDTYSSFEPFWYQGLFQILSVKHIFSGGLFTQEIELLGLADKGRPVQADSTELRPKPTTNHVEPAVVGVAEPAGDRVDVKTLVTSQQGIAFLTKEEGFSSKKYPDAGKWSIGYGHQLLPQEELTQSIVINGKSISIVNGITEAQGKALLAQDLKKYEGAIKQNIKVNMHQREFDALVSLVYNIGVHGFGKSTLRTVINSQQYSAAPTEFRKWRMAENKVHPGLVARREREIQMWGSST